MLFILANNLVSFLHKEVECKIKKLKYKKLEVIQPRIKNKSELPAGGYCILDQWTQSFTVAIDFWPSWLINAVYHLSVNNNKWERTRGLKRGGLLTCFPWKGRAYWKGGGGAFFEREALKVIRWFCTVHLLLRTTRWLPSKRSSKVTLKWSWLKRNAIRILGCGWFLLRWDWMCWGCA